MIRQENYPSVFALGLVWIMCGAIGLINMIKSLVTNQPIDPVAVILVSACVLTLGSLSSPKTLAAAFAAFALVCIASLLTLVISTGWGMNELSDVIWRPFLLSAMTLAFMGPLLKKPNSQRI